MLDHLRQIMTAQAHDVPKNVKENPTEILHAS